MRSNLLLLSCAVVMLSACSPAPRDGTSQNYIIGTEVKNVSSLTSDQGIALTKITAYDPTVSMIHEFNLVTGQVERSLTPVHMRGNHAVLYDQNGNYVIDLVDRYIGVYNKAGRLNQQPLTFLGNPKSAAFRPSTGHLVMYDDQSTVGMLKLDTDGNVQAAWSGGSNLDHTSIQCGDMDDQGHLVLAMADNSISVVDVDQTLSQGQWVSTNFHTTMSDIKWLAPVNGTPNQFLVRAQGQIALIDISTQAILDSVAINEQWRVKTSKDFDPHVMLVTDHNITIYYVQNSHIETHALNQAPESLLSTRLSLAGNTLTWMESTYNNHYWYEIDSLNEYKESRTLKRFRFSDMKATQILPVANEAEVQLTKDHIFELYQAKKGYACYIGLDDTSNLKFEKFNNPYMDRAK